MPYPNFHSARIETPDVFEKDSFRNKEIETGIEIIIGKKEGNESMETQAYRFDKEKFTPTEAKDWLEKHDIKYISFEEAKEEIKENSLDTKKLKAKSYRMSFFYPGIHSGYEGEYSSVYIDEKDFPKIANHFKGAPIIKASHKDLSVESNPEIVCYTSNLFIESNKAVADFSTADEETQRLISMGYRPSVSYKPIYGDIDIYDGNKCPKVIDIDSSYPIHIALVQKPRLNNVNVLENSLDIKDITFIEENKIIDSEEKKFDNKKNASNKSILNILFMNPFKKNIKNNTQEEIEKKNNEETPSEEKSEMAIVEKLMSMIESLGSKIDTLIEKDKAVHEEIGNTEEELKKENQDKVDKEEEEEMIDLYGEQVNKKELYNMYKSMQDNKNNEEKKEEIEKKENTVKNNSIIDSARDNYMKNFGKDKEEYILPSSTKGII